jgi:hypothetical protein
MSTATRNERLAATLVTRLVAASSLAFFAACGEEPAPENPDGTPAARGFTDCGTVVCQPGQYCFSAPASFCEPGCTSDVNCAVNQSCQDPDFANVGTCVNVGPVCGNGLCESGESAASCATDCHSGPVCGNGTCEVGESAASCAADCQTGPVCGNGTCEANETDANCPADCVDPVDACKEECYGYDFFDCFGPGELQACYDSCELATVTQITQYLNCGGAVFCDDSCFAYLP